MAAPTPSNAATAAPAALAPADCGGATSDRDFGSAVSSTTFRGSAISSPHARLIDAGPVQRESTSGERYSRPPTLTGIWGQPGVVVRSSTPAAVAMQVSSTFVPVTEGFQANA